MVRDHGALGQVLPVEPLGVLVARTLPGRVRVGKADRHARGQGDLGSKTVILGQICAVGYTPPARICLQSRSDFGRVVRSDASSVDLGRSRPAGRLRRLSIPVL